MTGTRILLIRHAETAWSLSRQHTGRTDLPLTDEGRRKARRLGERLTGTTFARVLTSPLQRARETCRLAGFGARAEARDDLMEWDYGDYEGRTHEEVEEDRPGWVLWRDGAPHGESPADVAARMDRVVDELVAARGRGDVAVFAHGHCLRALAVRWMGLPIVAGRQLDLDTGTVSELGWKRDDRVLRTWNDGSHLR